MLNSRKRIIVSLCILATVFIALIGVTYAYYVANVTGNLSENPSLSLRSGYLGIEYTDGSSSISGGSSSSTTNDLTFTKTFTIINDGVAETFHGIWIDNYKVTDSSGNVTTFSRPEDWTYTLTSENLLIKSGIFPIEDDAIITAMPLAVGESITYTLTVTYDYITEAEGGIDQSADIGKTLSFDVSVSQALDNLESAKQGTLLYAIKNNSNISDPVTIPGQAASSDTEAVLASTEDDYGISYYYRGNVTNNYVNYSGMCWRIVRVQGDGTIKLILADRDNECNAANYSADNTTSGFIADPSTQGFSYKFESHYESDFIYENSDIHAVLKAWVNGGTYKYMDMVNQGNTREGTFTTPRISAEDQEKLTTTEWCNDTSVTNQTSTEKYYGAYARLSFINTATPSLKCNGIEEDGSTQKKYMSNIGILSADEIAFAGSTTSGSSWNYYLKTNASYYYWTLSPYSFYEDNYAYIWGVASSGRLDYDDVDDYGGSVRPAVVLKRDVTITTTSTTNPGTQTNPYIIN